jgi:hypothetical protein
MSEAETQKFKKENKEIGKIVFLKESDLRQKTLERDLSLWVVEFYERLHSLCARKPRFSEMRPLKFDA